MVVQAYTAQGQPLLHGEVLSEENIVVFKHHVLA